VTPLERITERVTRLVILMTEDSSSPPDTFGVFRRKLPGGQYLLQLESAAYACTGLRCPQGIASRPDVADMRVVTMFDDPRNDDRFSRGGCVLI
jgi:hypothetical protein